MIGFLRKRARFVGVSAVAMAILLSACGYSASKAGGYGAGAGAASPAAASPSARAGGSASPVGTASIAGIGTVLVNDQGRTLYHLTTDSATKTTCTGGCAQVWPPLLATAGVPSPVGHGKFGTFQRPDGGMQVTFNGMLLYTYAGDSAPGQANGQGISGTWFAVTS